MKKNVLALSITAALVGFAGGAHAIITPGGATGDGLVENRNGTGQILLVPYFSTQGNNNTLLNLVNTDTANGKAVKVRFRGAANSDDIFDFQVFLSPGDVWSANIGQAASGKSTLTTGDTSCVKPDAANGGVSGREFVTDRLDPTLSAAAAAAGTREGYVEILNMADIPSSSSTTSLFYAIKHQAKTAPTPATPPCANAAWTALDGGAGGADTMTDVTVAATMGLNPPTGGMMANWTIINTTNATTFAGNATALQTLNGFKGNVVYFPQTAVAVTTTGVVDNYTADPLLAGAWKGVPDTYTGSGTSLTSATISAAYYDLPDLSTPYTLVTGTAANASAGVGIGSGAFAFTGTGALTNRYNASYTGPIAQATALTASIATAAIINEYITEPTLSAKTDWVFSMPTRRYSVAFDYTAGIPLYTPLTTSFFVTSNTSVENRVICVKNISPVAWDREEQSPTSSTGTVISPSTPAKPAAFCGETSVLAVNAVSPTVSTTLGATVAVKGLLANNGAYANGWAKLTTPGIFNNGLPILGGAFTVAKGPASAPFILGATWEHRYVRTQVSSTSN